LAVVCVALDFKEKFSLGVPHTFQALDLPLVLQFFLNGQGNDREVADFLYLLINRLG
jgi:hypothetical protein